MPVTPVPFTLVPRSNLLMVAGQGKQWVRLPLLQLCYFSSQLLKGKSIPMTCITSGLCIPDGQGCAQWCNACCWVLLVVPEAHSHSGWLQPAALPGTPPGARSCGEQWEDGQPAFPAGV